MPGTAGAWGAGPRERRVGVGRPGGPEASTRDGAEGLAGGVAGGAVKAAERAEASTPAGEEATRGLGAPGGGAREREEPSSSTDPRGTRFRGEERTFEWAWFAGPREAPGETKAEGGPPTEDSGAAASLSRGVGAVEERVVVVKTRPQRSRERRRGQRRGRREYRIENGERQKERLRGRRRRQP
jgi:hypothetical protein